MAGNWAGQVRAGQWTTPEVRAGGDQPVEELSAKGRHAPQLEVFKVGQRVVAQDLRGRAGAEPQQAYLGQGRLRQLCARPNEKAADKHLRFPDSR